MRDLDNYERSWHGPPESTMETVLYTANLLANGEQQTTAKLLTGLP
eukprot:COSAG01_NODE_31903_length_589_cov_2.438776_2_plen_46_part_00